MSKVEIVRKAGLRGESGEKIIPLQYDDIKVLNSGVYVAYFAGMVDLYTDKGLLKFTCHILDYKCDENDNIVAIKTQNEWSFVNIDMDTNHINVLYAGVAEVLGVVDGYILGRQQTDEMNYDDIFVWDMPSRKILFSAPNTSKVKVTRRGMVFTSKKTGLKSFYNHQGMVLKPVWENIKIETDYILATFLRNGKTYSVVFSYDGREIIVPDCITLRVEKLKFGEKEVPIFKVGNNFGNTYKQALIMIDGEELLPFDEYTDISFEEDNCIVVQKENESVLYKATYVNEWLKLETIVKADEISIFHNNDFLFKVGVGNKYGVYNSYGIKIIPIKYRDVEWRLGVDGIIVTKLLGNKKVIPANIQLRSREWVVG